MNIRNATSSKAIEAQVRVRAGATLGAEWGITGPAPIAAPQAFCGGYESKVVGRVLGVMFGGVLVAVKALQCVISG